jgi:hypothetical protein
MFDFLRVLIHFFDLHKIPYMLSGSMAMSTYTAPRYTKDFDFVVHLKVSDVPVLLDYFKEGYYCDEDSIRGAIKAKSMFNVIDHKSNYKAGFIILLDDEFEKTKFERRSLIDFMDMKLWIISPEDLLLSKLDWIQQIQSSLQADDIKQLSKMDGINWAYIWKWVEKLNLNTFGLIKK